MHDELIDDEDSMKKADEALDARVVMALETQPGVAVPMDFAARVAGKVALKGIVPVRETVWRAASVGEMDWRRTHYGHWMMGVSTVALLVAMLALAPRALAGSSALWVGLEWTLCAQYVLLALWFGLRRERLRC